MSKWILVAMLGAAFACERDRSTDEAGGEVGAERGAERDTQRQGAARGAEGEAREGAGEAGQELEEFGRDVGEGAEKLGQDVKEGAEDLGRDVEREWQEHTDAPRTPAGPTAQGQSGAENREVVQHVRQRLMDADLSLAAENVQVMAEGGKVTLRGNVASAEERAEVERLARSAPGVTEVDNRIEIGNR